MARAESRAMSLMRGLNVAPPGTATPRVVLVESRPADGATADAPTDISLEFSGPVRLTALVLCDAADLRVETDFSIGLMPARRHSVAVSPLEPGRYTVRWRARPADRQPIGGSFAFIVAGS